MGQPKKQISHTFKEGEEKLDELIINWGNKSRWEKRKSLIEWGNSLILQSSENQSDKVNLMPLPEPPPSKGGKATHYSFDGPVGEHYSFNQG